MLRIALVHILLFLLPFIGFALYLVFTTTGFSRTAFMQGPLVWLAGTGLIVTALGFFILAQFGGGFDAGSYAPAQYIDGELVPGRVE